MNPNDASPASDGDSPKALLWLSFSKPSPREPRRNGSPSRLAALLYDGVPADNSERSENIEFRPFLRFSVGTGRFASTIGPPVQASLAPQNARRFRFVTIASLTSATIGVQLERYTPGMGNVWG